MATEEWNILCSAKSYEEAASLVKSGHDVCQFRRSDLKDRTKYSFKCSHYWKYPLCRFEIQIIVPDDHGSITILSRNTHQHNEEEKNPTTRLPSPIRQCVSKCVLSGMSESQINTFITQEHSGASRDQSKLKHLINYQRRKDRPEIFSVYDLRQWCQTHNHTTDLHSTFVPYYTVNNIDDVFVCFTKKQLFQQFRCTSYLQVDATYKITWNDLPLLVFGSTDLNRRFKTFGIALVSSDGGSECYEQLFMSINAVSVHEFNQPCLITHIMADGAAGMFSLSSLLSLSPI